MRRDPAQLSGRSFDLLVIGAGIYGATIAWDATLRGLSVALVDKGDFGAATSANSLKTVHGGLRSLQRGNLRQMRSFIRERRTLLRVAPHLIEPITFAIPTTRLGARHPLAMRAALVINDLVASDRNRGLDPARRLPGGRVLSRAAYLACPSGIDPRRATGAAVWSDAQMFSSERLLLGFVQAAAARGAVTLNYVEALSLRRAGGRVSGAVVRDRLTGRSFDIEARVVVNAAGAWAPALSSAADGGGHLPPMRFAKAINLVTNLPAPPMAFGATDQGRFFFRVPWRGVCILGTSQDPFDAQPDELRVERHDVEALLASINAAFPGSPAGKDNVTLVHRGLLPITGVRKGDVQLTKESVVFDHRSDGLEGLVTVVGVRYTTARETAVKAVDVACRQLGGSPAPSRSAVTPIAGGDVESIERLAARATADASALLPPASIERLVRAYGSRYAAVLQRMTEDPELARPLGAAGGVTGAEIVEAIEDEMAVTLADALVRRTEAGAAGWPGDAAVEAAAAIMARKLGWDESRVGREIAELRALYTTG